MQFRSEFTPKPFLLKMKHTDKLLLVGSCFTEQIGKKLAAHKFDVLENPNGILFNPMSIAKAVMSYANEKLFSEAGFSLSSTKPIATPVSYYTCGIIRKVCTCKIKLLE